VPYFRTAEFSAVMLENEKLIKKFAKAEENARVVFLTSSGTGAMEAAVMNCFTPEDKVLVIDGGSFGHRFVELLELHGVPYTAIHPEFGQGVTEETLRQYDDKGYTGFLVNLDETSVGVLYDIRLISDFCTRNHIFLVVDSISSFLCDEFDMKALHVQVMITGSQKALACPPGVALVVLSEEAVERVNNNRPRTMYFDLKSALKNQERGQTPFTCAVGILLTPVSLASSMRKALTLAPHLALSRQKNTLSCLVLALVSKSVA
jgi:aspartate aminotransferase-like enzyme